MNRTGLLFVLIVVSLGMNVATLVSLEGMRKNRHVEAESFTLMDDHGKVMGRWMLVDQTPTLAMFDAARSQRVKLAAGPAQAQVVVESGTPGAPFANGHSYEMTATPQGAKAGRDIGAGR